MFCEALAAEGSPFGDPWASRDKELTFTGVEKINTKKSQTNSNGLIHQEGNNEN